MELKDLILSTLEELDEKVKEEAVIEEQKELEHLQLLKEQNKTEDRRFLEHTRERLLILFEGLQSDEVQKLESKLNITLEYLEYLLTQIDDRLQKSE
jgi:hypothetical protein